MLLRSNTPDAQFVFVPVDFKLKFGLFKEYTPAPNFNMGDLSFLVENRYTSIEPSRFQWTVARANLQLYADLYVEVSRSIGDAYMKHAQYNREPINMKFRISEPMNMPILTANPTIISLHLQPSDSFLIFASDGLWEHLSNEKAVEIVHNHPRAGIAKRLIKAALQEAARKREMRYSDLKRIGKKVRRHFHDDITVVVLFINHDISSRAHTQASPLSIRSALEH